MRLLIRIVVALELIVGIALLYVYSDYLGITMEDFSNMALVQRPADIVAPDSTYRPATVINQVQPNPAAGRESTAIEFITAVPIQPSDSLIDLMPAIQALYEPLPNAVSSGGYQSSDELVVLGRLLFHDPRLSVNQQISCSSCHILERYGVDNLPVSIGHDGTPGSRNSPTVYNAALHVAQFWDGRSPNVEEQAKVPITSANEMGMLEPAYVEEVLRTIPGYGPLFAAAFPNDPDPIRFDNVALAIGAFERQLLTPSRFDAFLQSDYSQLTEQEQKGLATFINIGCSDCHQGAPIGGLLYKRLGEVEPYQTDDLGRFDVTGQESDIHVFKVPSLRNVAYTGPYLHDGSVQTLEEMVVLMAKHQLGKNVTPEQVTDIVTFLYALTGELPAELIAVPKLPPTDLNISTQLN